MGEIGVKQICIGAMVIFAIGCLLYLTVFSSNGNLFGGDSSLKVSASNSIEFNEKNIVHFASNQKAGLSFKYYYDQNKKQYGIQIEKNYETNSTEVTELYGSNGVYLIQCDKLSFVYIVLYSETNGMYEVQDIYNSQNASSVIKVNKKYNGVTVKTIKKDGESWVAEIEGDVSGAKTKRAMSDVYEFPNYKITVNNVAVALTSTFNKSIGKMEFKIEPSTETAAPPKRVDADGNEMKNDMVCFWLSPLNSFAVCKFNTEAGKWTVAALNNIPICETGLQKYTKDQMVEIKEYGIFANVVRTSAEIKDKGYKIQTFDNEGNFLAAYDCMTTATLTKME